MMENIIKTNIPQTMKILTLHLFLIWMATQIETNKIRTTSVMIDVIKHLKVYFDEKQLFFIFGYFIAPLDLLIITEFSDWFWEHIFATFLKKK